MPENQSLQRAFAILQAVAAGPAGARVSVIAAHVRLPKSTVSRMLATLETLEAVERTDDDEFVIGSRLMALAQGAPYARHLNTIARPHMLELAERTGEAVALCVAHGDQMKVVDLVQTRHRVKVEEVTGELFPLHATSPGKVLLAFRSDKALRAYLRRPLARYTSSTITDPNVLQKQLARIRDADVAWAFGELDDIAGVSAPVRDETGQVTAAINLYGPAFRFPPKGKKDEMSRLVRDAARQVSARLAGGGNSDMGRNVKPR
jgi:DNA-binding IclR family transcriptional regulator